MDVGVHLPLMSFPGWELDASAVLSVAREARALGLAAVAANDHLVFATPWLDGPTALAAAATHSDGLDLMTTVLLPTIRGPIPTAKYLTTLSHLTAGRVIAGVGPGSSPRDHAAVGLDFEQRWPTFETVTRTLRATLDGESDVQLDPAPARPIGIWIGSWGSAAGLRRVARLADGWLASAYNTDPDTYAARRSYLDGLLLASGRDPELVPDALSTGFLRITDTEREADRFVRDVLAPALARDPDEIRSRVLVGTSEAIRELVLRYADAGLRRLLVWPIGEEVAQLQAFVSEIYPSDNVTATSAAS